MTNPVKIRNLFFAVIAFTLSTQAHAGVGLLGGLSFHNVSTDNGTGILAIERDSKTAFVGGLSFSTNFLLANIEIDALYNHRTLEVAGVSASSPAIEVPVMARFSIIPAILDLGVGPYAAFNVGSNELFYNSPDFGATGSIRVMVPTPGIHLVVDGRYNFGFTDLTDLPFVDLHTREFKAMVGIDIPFGKSEDEQQ